MAAPGARPAPVYRITGVRRGVSADVASRQRRYLISMAVRTVCFLLAVLTSGWLRWTFLLAALVLPYLSVIVANGGRQPAQGAPLTAVTPQRRALGSGDRPVA